MVKLPETSPWAEKYDAGARVRLPDIKDTEPGKIYDSNATTVAAAVTAMPHPPQEAAPMGSTAATAFPVGL